MDNLYIRYHMTFKRPEWADKDYFEKYILCRVGKQYTKDGKPWGHDSPYRIK